MRNNFRGWIQISLVIGLLGITSAAVNPSFAQAKSGLEVVPAFADITIEASESAKRMEIFYTNHGKEPLSLEMYPLDFRQQGERGEISFFRQFAGSYSYSLSSFLSLESNRLELAPGERKRFRVTVTNRQDLSPGGHYAAVVARIISDTNELKTAVSPSVSTLLLLKKTGGERYQLSAVDTDWPDGIVSFRYPRTLEIMFDNTGNIHLTPFGTVEVHDMFGRLIRKGIINNDSSIVFPESRRRITAQFDAVSWSWPVSVNTVKIQGKDSLKKATFLRTDTYVYINPVFAVCALLLVILGALVRRKRKGLKE